MTELFRSFHRAASLASCAVLALALSAGAGFAEMTEPMMHHHHGAPSTEIPAVVAPTGAAGVLDAAITFVCCAYNPTLVTINAGESVSWSGSFSFHPLRQVDGPNSDTPVPGGFANSTGTFYSVVFNTPGTYYYQCTNHGNAQFGGTMRGTIVVQGPLGVPVSNDLTGTTLAVAPNPIFVDARIRFSLSRSMDVDLALYDLKGALVRRLEQGRMPAGEHQANWDGRDTRGRSTAAGLYFVRLSADRVLLLSKVVKVH